MKFKKIKVVGDMEPRSKWIEALRSLKFKFGASALKLSTEDAAMSFEQIDYWSRLCSNIIPVVVKIGGPNARNDIKQLLALKVDGLIAPMVESSYGLENYIEAIRDYTTPLQYAALSKHVNIETKMAVDQLDVILESPYAVQLDEITIGCTDLCKSIQDSSLIQSVKRCVEKIKSKNLKVSIGGGISQDSIDSRLRDILPDKFNTRILTFDVKSNQNYRDAVGDALILEALTLAIDRKKGFISDEEEKFRLRELNKRFSPEI